MNKIKSKADVVIIGGGINGCSLAYQLEKKGKSVVLCEKSFLCSAIVYIIISLLTYERMTITIIKIVMIICR